LDGIASVVPAVPLSPAQELAWMAEMAGHGRRQYEFAARLRIKGALDVGALHGALGDVLSSREALRLSVDAGASGQPAQRAADARDLDTPLSFEEGAEGLERDLDVAFDIGRPPLVRWVLRRLGGDDWVLTHVEHHLVHDGTTFGLFLGELFQAYGARRGGRVAALAPERGYLAYAASVAPPAPPEQVVDRLAAVMDRTGGRAALAPAGDGPGATGGSTGPAQARVTIPPPALDAVRQAAADERRTPFSCFLGRWGRLLAACLGLDEVVVGTTVDVRPPGFANCYGMFVNTVPVVLAARATGTEQFRALLGATGRRDVPIHHLTRALGLHGAGGVNPLFGTLFSLHDHPLPARVDGLEVTVEECVPVGASKFPLDVLLVPDGRRSFGGAGRGGRGGGLLVCDYDPARYGAGYVRALLDAYVEDLLATGRTTAPGWRPAVLTAPRDEPRLPAGDLAGRFLDAAAHEPDAVCLRQGEDTRTFAGAAAAVRDRAAALRRLGLVRGDLVTLQLPRGPDLVLWELACLHAGGVFAALGSRADPERLRGVLSELRPGFVVTVAGPSRAPGPLGRATRLPEPGYVALTSGSTATPRAVFVPERALARVSACLAGAYGLCGRDTVTALADPAFDLHLEETLPTLGAGGRVVFPTGDLPSAAALLDLCESSGVTVLNLGAGYAGTVAAAARAAGRSPAGIRLVVLGSERVTPHLVRALAAAFPGARLCNAYGLTESCITSVVGECSPGEASTGASVPAGRPIARLRATVVNPAGDPLPAGLAGELVLEGDVLASGYLRAGEIVPLPTGPSGGRMLATGDLATISGGVITVHGRLDEEVKVRGVRGRLADVEERLVALLGVEWCAVVVLGAGSGEHLAACLPAGVRAERARVSKASETLRVEVDAAFVPERWVFLDELPRLASGKVDRVRLRRIVPALADPLDEPGGHGAVPADVAAAVHEVWTATLRGRVEPGSDFFDAGGHSLVANEVSARLGHRFGARPPTRLLYVHPRFEDYARAVAGFLRASGATSTADEYRGGQA
jgi:acyl-coenzyme A synthetase/AMP-(fatty) acid ligase